MLEQQPLARFAGECAVPGYGRPLNLQIFPDIVKGNCKLFEQGICLATEKRCEVFSEKIDEKMEGKETMVSITAAGIVIYDRYRNEIVKSPYLPDMDENIPLTNAQGGLVQRFMLNQGLILTREELMKTIGGTITSDHRGSVDVHIGHLRRKLGQPSPRISNGPSIIESVKKQGYRWSLSRL